MRNVRRWRLRVAVNRTECDLEFRMVTRLCGYSQNVVDEYCFSHMMKVENWRIIVCTSSCPVLEPLEVKPENKFLPNEKWIVQQWFRTGILEASAYYNNDMADEIRALQKAGRDKAALQQAQEKAQNEL